MFKGLKNLVNSVTNKVQNAKESARKEVRKYQNIYAACNSGVTPTHDQVKEWVADELNKLSIPTNYIVHFATESDYVALWQSTYNDVVKHYSKKAGVLNKFKFVRNFIQGMGQGAAQRTESFLGITMFKEITDKDEVIFYVDHIVNYWSTLAFEENDTPEEIVRQVVRHEVRHAWQFTHLREIGGSDLVKRVWDREQTISYTSRATERDAFGGQRDGYGDLSEFVKLVEKEMGMKLI